MINTSNINIIALGIFSMLLMACSSNKDFKGSYGQSAFFDRPDISAKIKTQREKSMPYHIHNIKITGNNMIIDFEYLKSCKGEDSYELVGLPLEDNFEPPRRTVELVVNNADKTCNSLENYTLTINISELASSKDLYNEVDLYLDGWRLRPMKYIYINAYE